MVVTIHVSAIHHASMEQLSKGIRFVTQILNDGAAPQQHSAAYTCRLWMHQSLNYHQPQKKEGSMPSLGSQPGSILTFWDLCFISAATW